jgi:hypothetical protein
MLVGAVCLFVVLLIWKRRAIKLPSGSLQVNTFWEDSDPSHDLLKDQGRQRKPLFDHTQQCDGASQAVWFEKLSALPSFCEGAALAHAHRIFLCKPKNVLTCKSGSWGWTIAFGLSEVTFSCGTLIKVRTLRRLL